MSADNSVSALKVSRWVHIFAEQGAAQQARPGAASVDNITINMQPNQSVGNLQRLGEDMASMDLSARTAASTPTSRADVIPSQAAAISTMPSEYVDSGVTPATFPQPSNRPELAAIVPVATTIVHDAMPTPRADRLTQPITPQNAQGLLPPDCCLFIANLSADRPDQDIADTVQEAFKDFGYNVVKIRRDRHQHPFALVQFDNAENAHRALQSGQNMVVGGRKIRTELAQARRSIIIYKNDGTAISNQEIFQMLRCYGHIEDTKPTTDADARMGLPHGCWVKFSFYLDYKDCLNNFSPHNGLYLIIDAPNPDASRRGPLLGGLGYGLLGPNTPRSSADTRSVFVGNLPYNVSEQEIVHLFQPYGIVRMCNVIRKPISGQGHNTFAFVEFSNPHEAWVAAGAAVDLRGRRVRVEPKEYSIRRHTRAHGQSPRRPPGYHMPQWGPQAYGQSPPHHLPYDFQPKMGNYDPHNSGPPWNTSLPSAYQPRGISLHGQYFNRSSYPPQHMATWGPPADHSHTGPWDPPAPTYGLPGLNTPLPPPPGPPGPIASTSPASIMSPQRDLEAGDKTSSPSQEHR